MSYSSVQNSARCSGYPDFEVNHAYYKSANGNHCWMLKTAKSVASNRSEFRYDISYHNNSMSSGTSVLSFGLSNYNKFGISRGGKEISCGASAINSTTGVIGGYCEARLDISSTRATISTLQVRTLSFDAILRWYNCYTLLDGLPSSWYDVLIYDSNTNTYKGTCYTINANKKLVLNFAGLAQTGLQFTGAEFRDARGAFSLSSCTWSNKQANCSSSRRVANFISLAPSNKVIVASSTDYAKMGGEITIRCEALVALSDESGIAYNTQRLIDDCQALLNLKTYLLSSNPSLSPNHFIRKWGYGLHIWGHVTNRIDYSIYKWPGLRIETVGSREVRVVGIHLSNPDIGNYSSFKKTGNLGTALSYILSLSQLRYLNFSNNSLTGTIDSTGVISRGLSYFSNLKELNLDNNVLTGSVPSSICNLRTSRSLEIDTSGNTGLTNCA